MKEDDSQIFCLNKHRSHILLLVLDDLNRDKTHNDSVVRSFGKYRCSKYYLQKKKNAPQITFYNITFFIHDSINFMII
jgi:hypothetical protein